jgi:putative flippase GtrA
LESDAATIRSAVLSRDAHPLIQFAKYVFCGGLAFATHNIVTYGFGLTVFPAVGPEIPTDTKEANSLINNSIGFCIAGVVAYVTNALFVFTPGRHDKATEIGLFIGISAIAYVGGIGALKLIYELVRGAAWGANILGYVEHFGNLGFAISSALVNFVCRKFIVFKG